MASPVATVAFIEGQAWAKAPDGSLRVLALGDTLNVDEVLITAEGARVELDFGDGPAVVIGSSQEVTMGPDLWNASVTDRSDAELTDASIQQALTILEQGGDLSAELEETAAGNNDASGGGGNSFVQVERTDFDPANDQIFEFGDLSRATASGNLIGDNLNNPAAIIDEPVIDEPVIDEPVIDEPGIDEPVIDVPVVENTAPETADLNYITNEDTPISGQIIGTDVDGDSLTYVIGTPPANGSVVLDPTTGEFVYTPNTDYNGGDSFIVTVDDGNGGTVTSVVTIDIVPVNDAPETTDLNYITNEDTPVSGQVIGTDVDGDSLTYIVGTPPANGSVVLDPTTGEFVYTPNTDYNGGDSFVVTVDDGNGGTTTSHVTFDVLPVNDAPVANNLNLVTPEDTPVPGAIKASDVDGDTLSYNITTGPSHGTVSLNSATGEFVYTPNNNYNGGDSFIVTVDDGNGGTATSLVTIGITPVNVTPPVNEAPITEDLSVTTPEDTPVSGTVDASDVDGDTLTYTVTNIPANGSVTLDSATGEFTYTPGANYNGGDSFVVTVDDGNGGTATSTVTIDVTPVNQAPTADDLSLTTPEDTPVSGTVDASDVDGDTLTYTVTDTPANGSVTLDSATGEFTYTPGANYNGGDSFVVTVDDGNGGTTTSTVIIEVTPVNDAPVADDLNLTTPEDTPVSGTVDASDVDGDTLTYTVTDTPTNGSVTLDSATGEFTYTPGANYNGGDSFVVTVDDGNGGTATSTVTIDVTPVNQAPTADDLSLTTPEDTPVSGTVDASDVDGDTLTYTVTNTPANGSVSLDSATGEFTYTPGANYNGGDSFVVTVNDGNGGTTTSTVTIDVTPVNDAPTADDLNLTTPEDTPVSGTVDASDVDGDTLTYTVTNTPANGSVSLDSATGEFTYTPGANYNGGDSFVVTVDDGNGGTTTSTVTIDVTPVNDAPTADDLSLTTPEDTPVSGTVDASDVDGDTLTYTVTNTPANGSVTLDSATGEFTYTPGANYNGGDSFVVTVDDGNGGTTTSTVIIDVTPVNQAPTADDLSLTTPEDTPVSGTVDASDVDGDTLTYTVTDTPTNGSVTLDSATGEFTYTPGANYNGGDSFVVTVDDGNGGTTTSTVTIDVTPVADAPTLLVTAETVAETTLVPTVPSGTGLTEDYYQALPGLTLSTAGVTTDQLKTAMDAASPTSSSAITEVDYPSITTGDAYHITGFIYLEAGQSYQLMGSRDDTLRVTVGGKVVYDAGLNQWGTIDDEVREGNNSGSALNMPITTSGYYSLDIMVLNADFGGDLSLSLSVNGAPALALNSTNFNLYTDASGIVASNGADEFDLNIDIDADGQGGFYPIAEGVDYTYFNLDISANLSVATEVLAVEVADIPVGASLTDGTNVFTSALGSDSADVTGWDLGSLQLVPATGYAGAFALTVTATSTDGTDTESVSQTINLNVLANDTNNVIGSGVLTGSAGSDLLVGLAGDDQLVGGAGADILIGGAGNDTLTGGVGADIFKWSFGDQGVAGTPAQDVITDFNADSGDVLDLADLLQGESAGTLTDYLHFTSDGTSTTLHISSAGGFDGGFNATAIDQTIVLQNVSLTGTDTDIINQLKGSGSLLTD